MLILPLASLDELFTSVLFDVLEMNQESLIVLQPTILMNKESYLLNTGHAVAGVACKQCYCECPVTTQIATLRPTQQAHRIIASS